MPNRPYEKYLSREERIHTALERIEDKVDEHATGLATLTERSEQNEKRLDRAEKRGWWTGGVSGAGVIAAIESIKASLGGN